LTSKEATVKKVMDLREKIRSLISEMQKRQVQRLKTQVILFSTSKYPRQTMVKAVDDFEVFRKQLVKDDTELEKLFKKLYSANLEYQDSHKLELIA